MHYNCLIVDDEIDLSKMTCEYFEMFGVSCSYVENAAQCMGFLEEHEVDIILLDINLEKESGFDLCKKIREEYNRLLQNIDYLNEIFEVGKIKAKESASKRLQEIKL